MRSRLRRLLTADPALAALLAEVEAPAGASDPGHDHGHLLRVAEWTLRLAGDAVDERSAVAAALLHDAVNPAKDSGAAARASERSAGLACRLLPGLGFAAGEVETIADAIRDHSYRRGAVPTTALGRALQDADRLDALGAIGIFRALACGARLGAALYDPDDPWAERRELDDRRFTVDHFFTKLLRLGETLQTEAGRREATRRLEPMRLFLARLGEEIGRPPPPLP